MLCNGYDYDELIEYETTVGGLHIRLAKVGGGTVGRAYEGRWAYSVDGADWSDDLHTGTPKSHLETALILSELYEEEN